MWSSDNALDQIFYLDREKVYLDKVAQYKYEHFHLYLFFFAWFDLLSTADWHKIWYLYLDC